MFQSVICKHQSTAKNAFLTVCVEFVTLACFDLQILSRNIVSMFAFPRISYFIFYATHIICLPGLEVGEKYKLLWKVQNFFKSCTMVCGHFDQHIISFHLLTLCIYYKNSKWPNFQLMRLQKAQTQFLGPLYLWQCYGCPDTLIDDNLPSSKLATSKSIITQLPQEGWVSDLNLKLTLGQLCQDAFYGNGVDKDMEESGTWKEFNLAFLWVIILGTRAPHWGHLKMMIELIKWKVDNGAF